MKYWKSWIKYAGIRAIKTFAVDAVAVIGTAAAIGDVDWLMVLSASALAAILSLITSLAGLPELDGTSTKSKIGAAGIRALKMVAQAAASTIGTTVLLGDVNWMQVLSVSLLSGIVSILVSISGGLPEADGNQ